MKPIRLEIEGINSYAKKQIVDFEKLTSRGIFGIFGKTGSGKSTILDAITLALYGNIARGTKEFINSGCEKATVDYEFEIGQGRDRYIYKISRRFKKKVNGNKTTFGSDYVRLMKKSAFESQDYDIIADKVSDTNKCIKDILGLEESDFLKSVVLPQGKFNEFLTLDGKNRRNMLERIFNLEEYGTELNIKLGREKNKVNSSIDILNARLSEYPDVNLEAKEKLEKEVEFYIKNVNEINEKLSLENKKLIKYQAVYDLCIERESILREIEELENRKEEINSIKSKVELSDKANLVKPEIDKIDIIQKNISEIEKNMDDIKQKKSSMDGLYEVLKTDYDEILKKKENISDFRIARKDIERLIEIDRELFVLRDKEISSSKLVSDFEKSLELLKNEMAEIEKNVKLLEELKQNNEKILNENKVDRKYKNIVLDALNLEKEHIRLSEDIQKENEFIEKERIELKSLLNKLEISDKFIDKKEEEIGNIINSILEQEKIETLDDDMLDNISRKIVSLENEISSVKDLESKITVLSQEKTDNLNIIRTDREKESILKIEIDNIDKIIRETEEKIEKREVDDLSQRIRISWIENFHSGDRCPVCNSHIESIDAISDNKDTLYSNIERTVEEKKKLEQLNEKRDGLYRSLIELSTRINFDIEKDKKIDSELEEKNKELNKRNSEELEKNIIEISSYRENQRELREIKYKNIEKLNQQKLTTEREKEDLVRNKIAIKTSIESKESIISAHSDKISEIEKIRKDILEKLLDIKEKNCLSDIEKVYNEICAKEEILDKTSEDNKLILLDLENNKLKLQKNTDEKTKLELNFRLETSKLSRIKEDIEKTGIKLEEVHKNLDWNLFQESNVDTDDYSGVLKFIDLYEKETLDLYEKTKVEIEKLDGEINKLETLINKMEVEKDSSNKLILHQQQIIDELIEKFDFLSIEDVMANYCVDEELNRYKKTIDDYEKNVFESNIKLDENSKKLAGRNIKKEELENQKSVCDSIQIELDENKDKKSKTVHELEKMEKSLLQVRDILDKLELKQKNKDSIVVLEKVLRGNKFVEYLSQIYLKNIVYEASERLSEITNGRYSLEIDSEYTFVVRDNFNGGIRRAADTLSGGETFLTSLALALALSSQIQLKGRAALEFFFLDEGFGTLDSELLDTVMESLEKLKSNTMSVGIISHVEELKNRIPMKLLVEMDSVESTSIVRIENS